MEDCKYLTLEELLSKPNWKEVLTGDAFNLTVREDTVGDKNFAIIKYDMRKTDLSLPAVREARGVIIDTDTMQVVCRPFHKFFNAGEPFAAKIDFTKEVWHAPKKDGSLIKVWKYKDVVYVSTNGTVNAYTAKVGVDEYTYGQLFEDIVDMEKIGKALQEGETAMFELQTPLNKVVIDHTTSKVDYLISRTLDGNYFFNEDMGYPCLWEPLGLSIEELRKRAELESEEELIEGYVVLDASGEMLKIKTSQYVEMHYFATTVAASTKGLIEVVLDNEEDEVLAYLPDLADKLFLINFIKGHLETLVKAHAKRALEGYAEGEIDRKEVFRYIDDLHLTDDEKSLVRAYTVSAINNKEVRINRKTLIRAIQEQLEE